MIKEEDIKTVECYCDSCGDRLGELDYILPEFGLKRESEITTNFSLSRLLLHRENGQILCFCKYCFGIAPGRTPDEQIIYTATGLVIHKNRLTHGDD